MKILFLIIGIFSTMNVIKIPLINISLAYLSLIISVIILIFKNCNSIRIRKKLIVIFYILLIISTLINSTYQTSEYVIYSFKNIFFIIIIYLPLVILLSDEECKLYSKFFVKGLFISIYIQSFWALAEIILWYKFNFKLNDYIFGEILKVNSAGHAFTNFVYTNTGTVIRSTGIGWEPAQLGFLLLLGFFISKKGLCKIYFFIMIVISNSRTSLMGLIIVSMYLLVNRSLKRKLISKNNIKIIICAIILMIVVCIKLDVYNKLGIILSRINLSFIKEDAGSLRHYLYYPYGIDIMLNRSNILQQIFGYGTAIAGYPYTINSDIASVLYNIKYTPWQPETDYVSIFVGNGLLGIITYISILITNLIKNKKNEFFYISTLILISCGFFYVYYNYIWINLILIFSNLYVYNNNEHKTIYKFKTLVKDSK